MEHLIILNDVILDMDIVPGLPQLPPEIRKFFPPVRKNFQLIPAGQHCPRGF